MPATAESMPELTKSHTPDSCPVGAREIVVVRDFDAPRELVYAAFVDPKHVPAWWGPKGFTVETQAIDVRVGGLWRFTLRGSDGKTWTNRIAYTELNAPSRIAYDHGSDVDVDPARFHVVITFEVLAGHRTRVTMHSTFPSAAQRDGVLKFNAVELGKSTLGKCASHVASRMFVEVTPGSATATIRRLLHAPRALVWEAMTRPEHVTNWYGPKSTRVTECAIDLRVGGKYRFVLRGDDGREHAFSGEYRELVAPELLVQTWCWEGAPDASSVERMRLVDLGDRTLVEVSVEHTSALDLEMHMKHGMEAGANETYARLDALLPEMASAPTSTVLERTFAAPRALVFDAWTKAEHFRKWFGPNGASMPTCELDARPGGAIRFCHQLEGGSAHWLDGRYDVVEPTTRLVFTLRFTGSAPVPEWPADAWIETRVTLMNVPGGTHQHVEQVIFPEAARNTAAARSECAMAKEGWRETLDHLFEHLSQHLARR